MNMGKSEKLLEAFKLFDDANAQDPNKESFEGKLYPKELLYAQRMTDILNEFSDEVKPKNFIYSIGIDIIRNCFNSRNSSFQNIRKTT